MNRAEGESDEAWLCRLMEDSLFADASDLELSGFTGIPLGVIGRVRREAWRMVLGHARDVADQCGERLPASAMIIVALEAYRSAYQRAYMESENGQIAGADDSSEP